MHQRPQPDREIIAVIAYLQRLGTDIKAAPVAAGGTGQDRPVNQTEAQLIDHDEPNHSHHRRHRHVWR